MKKLVLGIIALLLMLPLTVNAEEKVKVYIFEAGGCPACEAEMEYLKGLDGYNKTFEVIEKEAYIDHIKWEQGKDYNLAVKVATAFNEAGFSDATYTATPFIVVSDIYAAAAYNANLETVIEEAASKGDKDIVGCFEDGKTTCLDHLKPEVKKVDKGNTIVVIAIICVLAAGAGTLVYTSKKR